MAVEGIQIRVVDQEIGRTLDRIDRVAANPGAIMQDVAGYLVTATQRHFETETGSDGKWPRLSPRTAAKRIGRRKRGFDNMLRVSNRLYSSIVGEATASEAMVGTNAVQAALQNFGGKVEIPAREQEIHLGRTNRGWRFTRASAKRKQTRQVSMKAHTVTIPAREFLYLTDADHAEITDIAAEGFRREAGLP